jgi:hypothetical protein
MSELFVSSPGDLGQVILVGPTQASVKAIRIDLTGGQLGRTRWSRR